MKFDPELLDRMKSAKRVVVFTGAGVSQESGIPTFRDALTGLWRQFDPQELATPQAYFRQPNLVWGWYEWRRAKALRCRPNPAHLAISAMARQIPDLILVTQNVDALHEAAGSQDVIHLHGSLHHPRCAQCGCLHTLPPGIPDEPEHGRRIDPPKCVGCGGRVRPGVVWFGEDLPVDALGKARSMARSCEVLLSIGTSSLVYPAALLPREAAEKGACVVQVNPAPTELDRLALFNLRGTAGEVMPALLTAVWGKHLDEH